MELTTDQRLDLLKLEMQLIQGVFDKYDAMIFNSRNWFVTLWTATMGAGLTVPMPALFPMAALLAALYWVLEGMMRHQYWFKYVVRYRTIRTAMNECPPNVEGLSIYDLTNRFGLSQPSEWDRVKASFSKLEPLVLYAALSAGSAVVWLLVWTGKIVLKAT